MSERGGDFESKGREGAVGTETGEGCVCVFVV